jgi:hypothetical protein
MGIEGTGYVSKSGEAQLPWPTSCLGAQPPDRCYWWVGWARAYPDRAIMGAAAMPTALLP